ncbi:hypothetical protein N5079_04975 [Planotetraspora sp. A-T 1434]|uniref:hypothetical protein n=1 Tax=Planotetraspora sp. A-T 1434 TaxID=2979219 RepID=UPI0021BF956B|nr:hypothetical protein [Planotetraspora sp. A-T 1434]MCT9929570.1 hypothetical protein [Planotetraspora sp. A-T 1434]
MPPTLAELEQPCAGCGHQNAVHTGGAKPGGWAIYERTWANASGWCNTPGCDCPGRR